MDKNIKYLFLTAGIGILRQSRLNFFGIIKEKGMKSKDITQKMLERYNDVFADILNVLLFNGKRIIEERLYN